MDSIGSKPVEPQGVSRKLCLACNREYQDAGISHCPHDHTQLVNLGRDEITEYIGKTINGKFKILELVGKGGMGTVYKAEQLGLGRHVAVKILKAQLSEDKVSVKRFEQEATASAALQHPNLIMLHDHGMIDEKQPYIVMELLEGEGLNSVIRELGGINPVRCLRIFSQVMDGLRAAHDKGVVHRDIKPSNILLCRGDNMVDVVKVVDFGLAKLMPWSGKESQHLTKIGEVFGSPIYMSPEQCQGKKLEPSSDIYSVGVTLYEALTGKPPFKGRNVVETASMHISQQPAPFEVVRPDLRLSNKLQSVIFKALDKDPARRFLNMTEFKQALTEAISGPGANQGFRAENEEAEIPVAATQPVKRSDLEGGYKPSKITARQAEQAQDAQQRRSSNMWAVLSVILLLAVGGGIAWFLSPKPHAVSTAENQQSITGRVYYLELEPVIDKQSKSRAGYLVKAVHLMPDQAPSATKPTVLKLTADIRRKRSESDTLKIGSQWQCKYSEDRLGKFESIEKDNRIFDAYKLLYSFLTKLEEKNVTNKDIIDQYVDQQTAITYPSRFSDLPMSFTKNFKLKPLPVSDSLTASVDIDPYVTVPLPQNAKIVDYSYDGGDSSISFLINKAMMYNDRADKPLNPPLYQKFTLKFNPEVGWKIVRIDNDQSESEEWERN